MPMTHAMGKRISVKFKVLERMREQLWMMAELRQRHVRVLPIAKPKPKK